MNKIILAMFLSILVLLTFVHATENWVEINVHSTKDGTQTTTIDNTQICILSKTQMELPLDDGWGNPACRISRNDDGEWWMQAWSEEDSDASVECDVGCLSHTGDFSFAQLDSDREGVVTKMLGQQQYCGMRKVQYVLPGDDGDPLCEVNRLPDGVSWEIEVFSKDGSDLAADCSALCIEQDDTVGNEYSLNSGIGDGGKKKHIGVHKFCYISGQQLEIHKDNGGSPSCKVDHNGDNWELEAFSDEDGELGAHCSAICKSESVVNIACNTNSECGTDGYVGMNMCSGNDVTRDFITYTCSNAGTAQSYCSSSTEDRIVQYCSYQCNNGDCIPQPEPGDNRFHDLTVEDIIFLNVLDNVLVKNHAYNVVVETRNLGNFTENVNFNGKLLQSSSVIKVWGYHALMNFAPGGFRIHGPVLVTFDVPVGYYNVSVIGSITNDSNIANNERKEQITIVNCVVNGDCGVGMVCLNSGMINSNCVPEQPPINITCSSNSQCGVDGYVNDNTCVANNVTRNYITYMCNNPGMANSYCTSSVETRTLQECSYQCSNGSCIPQPPIECNDNNDCNDHDSGTVDICVNAGEIDSFCKHRNDRKTSGGAGTGGFCGDFVCSEKEEVWCFEDCGIPFELTKAKANPIVLEEETPRNNTLRLFEMDNKRALISGWNWLWIVIIILLILVIIVAIIRYF